jgi:8-oxo-dGTP pyrophosphatase MutT (NUDIX family)
MAVEAVYLVLINEGKLLLSCRQNTGYEDGNYGLVAGHVEAGETLRRAMVREAREEAGLELSEADLELALTMHRFSPTSSPHERLDFFMTANKYTGEPVNKEREKCSDLAWFARSHTPDNLIAYIREALNLIAEDVRYSEYGW